MHMVRRRRAALGTIINDEVSVQGSRNIQHASELVRDLLCPMFPMSNRQVMLQDWKRIAVDSEVAIERQAFLCRGQIRRAQEAWAFRHRLPVNPRRGTGHSMGDMADEDLE